MKIGVDLRCLNNKVTGGVSVYTYNLLRSLLLIDNSNSYKIFTNRQVVEELFSDISKKNVKFFNYKIPNKFFNASLKLFNYPKIDKLINGVDVFWLPNINFLALSTDCKLITTVHDISYKLMPEFYSLKGKLWHYFINPKCIFKTSKAIISVSLNTKNDLIKHYNIPDNKVEVIYPGLEEIYQDNNYINKYDKLNDHISKNYILTVATLEPRKNIETIILAFEKLLIDNPNLVENNWQLIILGKPGWLNHKILKLHKKSNYYKQIKFFDNVSKEKLPLYYKNAKIFVWPSFYEGFGFPPLEALKSNLPVITSFNSSLTEIFKTNVIYVNPFNINELQKALEIFIKKPGVIKDRMNDLNNFSWNNSAKNLLNLINKI